jgi:hypothetical protein
MWRQHLTVSAGYILKIVFLCIRVSNERKYGSDRCENRDMILYNLIYRGLLVKNLSATNIENQLVRFRRLVR